MKTYNSENKHEIEEFAAEINKRMKRTDAKAIVTNAYEDDEFCLMITGWDQEQDEETGECGYFIDIPSEDGEKHRITYAGVPHPADKEYVFYFDMYEELMPEIERLNLN